MMDKTRTLVILLVALLALWIAGCGRDKEPTPTPAPPAPAAAAPAAALESAPAAAAPADTPLVAAGASPLPTESPLPTPALEPSGMAGESTANTGAVTGRILVTRDGADMPVAGMMVGLAEVIRDETGVARATGYEPSRAFKGVTDEQGGFAVNDVAPGTYSLILDAAITSYQLNDPISNETILVDVKPGATVDIGVKRYESLPIPGFSAP